MTNNMFEGLSLRTEDLTVTVAGGVPESTVEVVEAEDGTKVPVPAEPGPVRKQSPRVSFPEVPGQTFDYMDLSSSSEPRVERRWFRYRTTGLEQDYLWYGPCLYCEQALWALADKSTTMYQSASQALQVIERDDREYRFCRECASRESRVESAIQSKSGEFTGPYEWPRATIKKIMGKPEWVRNKMLSEVVPVVPRHGALVRVKEDGALLHFDRFEDGLVRTMDGGSFGLDAVEALTPAHPGITYARATAMPLSGRAGTLIKVMSWQGKDPSVQVDGQTRSVAWSSQHVAALSPVVDPSTETPEQTIKRLERERDRLEHGMHARMVAEGVARSWCSEFDQILDATGLPPRTVRNMVTGTMTFTQTMSGEVSENSLAAIKRRWRDHIRVENITITSVERVPEDRMPLITPA